LIQVFKSARDDLSLLQVVSKILGMTPEEVRSCTEAVNNRKAAAEAGYLPDLPDLTSYLPTILGGGGTTTS